MTNAEFAEFVKATGCVTVGERAPDPALHPDIPKSQLVPGATAFVSPVSLARGGDVTQWWQFIQGVNWRHPEGPDSSIEGRENHPVVDIAYEDALAYAKWRGHELPTEAEWEYASLGGLKSFDDASGAYANGKPIANTWQGIFPVINTKEDGYAGTAPVGCFPANGYGLYDMIGNVWEWTSDWYGPTHGSQPALNPLGPSTPVSFEARRAPSKVIKGGSYLCSFNYCARYRPTARQPQEVDHGSAHVGFRTILRDRKPDGRQAKSDARKATP